MRCNDCGTPNYEPSAREDVCVTCFELRGRFMQSVVAGTVSSETFASAQKAMRGHSHRAAAVMQAALTPPASALPLF